MYDDMMFGLGTGMIVLYFGITAFYLMVGWKIFEKAGKPGWGSLIPIFNIILMLEITGRPSGWFVLWFFFSPIMYIIYCFDLAAAFGKDSGYGVGLWLLGGIFLPILAFGDAQYQGNRH